MRKIKIAYLLAFTIAAAALVGVSAYAWEPAPGNIEGDSTCEDVRADYRACTSWYYRLCRKSYDSENGCSSFARRECAEKEPERFGLCR